MVSVLVAAVSLHSLVHNSLCSFAQDVRLQDHLTEESWNVERRTILC